MPLHKVFAIIVTYNGMRNDWIQKCFDSVLTSSVPVQIIAIDNNSSDTSVEFIKNNYQEVILIENKENKGFGGANNQGLTKALQLQGDFFFLLNQDAKINSETIEKLVEVMDKDKRYAVVSPIHLDGKGEDLDYNFSKYIVPHNCKLFYSDSVLNKVQNKIYEVSFVCAAGWMLSKNSLEKIGGFNPSFFHYGEDDNYCHRVYFKGFKIGILPNIYIFHDRKDRGKSIYQNKKEDLKRNIILKYSNPFEKNKINKDYAESLLKCFINIVIFRFQYSKYFYQRALIIRHYRKTIIINKNKSISDQKYVFLK